MQGLGFTIGRLILAFLFLSGGSLGSALAQWPNYMTPDKKETPKDSKPPGKMTPGHQGASKYGWGITKTPGAKGADAQGLKKPKSQEYRGPSQPRGAAPIPPHESKAPKGPPQPKSPKSPQGLEINKPEAAKVQGGPPPTPKTAFSSEGKKPAKGD